MKMIRYNDPNEVFRNWDSFFADPFRAFAPLFRSTLSSAYERPQSLVEWYEDEEIYHARVELPGVKREDLRVDAEDGLIRFSYDYVEPRGEDSGSRSVRFEQVLRSPEGVRLKGIDASLRDGILELTLPKTPETKPIQIEIK